MDCIINEKDETTGDRIQVHPKILEAVGMVSTCLPVSFLQDYSQLCFMRAPICTKK